MLTADLELIVFVSIILRFSRLSSVYLAKRLHVSAVATVSYVATKHVCHLFFAALV